MMSILRTGLAVCLLFLLGGCAGYTYKNPLLDLPRQEGPLSSQRLHVVFSPKAAATIQKLTDKSNFISSWGGSGADTDPRNLTDGLRRILSVRFQSVTFAAPGATENPSAWDISAVVDFTASVGSMSFDTNHISVTLRFTDKAGHTIDTVEGKGSSSVPYPAFTLRFREALDQALLAVGKAMDASRPLLAFANRSHAPAVAQAAPAARPSKAVSEVAADVGEPKDSPNWAWSKGLGLYIAATNAPLRRDLGITRTNGFVVLAVAKGGAGDAAGVRAGDLLIGLSPKEMFSQAGRTGRVEVIRAGRDLVLNATSRALPSNTTPTFLFPENPAHARATVVVDPNGAGNYRTITAALLRARAGDTVVVEPGSYRESVLLPPGVTVRAAQKSLVRIAANGPWLVTGAKGVKLSGLSFSEGGLSIYDSDDVDINECEFTTAPKSTGVTAVNSKAVKLIHGIFHGAAEAFGVSARGTEISVANSVFTGYGRAAVLVTEKSRGDVSRNLMNDNNNGIEAGAGSVLTARSNIITGNWTPESKDKFGNNGFWLENATGTLIRNVIRRQRDGIYIEAAPAPVKIVSATVTQGLYGIALAGSSGSISDSLIMHNRNDAIYVSFSTNEKKQKLRTGTVQLVRNTISGNEGDGIDVVDFDHVVASENLIESNGDGIDFRKGKMTIRNNTIVLQRYAGIRVSAGSNADIHNNIVALNTFGLFLDVTSKLRSGNNDVYGNLASTKFPLEDGNYVRVDRYVSLSGKKVLIDVYPAYDLKAKTDLALDPGFVKVGDDYRLKPNSPLRRVKGEGRRYLGAYAPASRAY